MDFGYNGGNGSSDDREEISNFHKPKKSYHRHTTQQIQQLELFFKEYPHPDENQRRQLSRDLGLESRQVKFWFQNKRTQTKAQNERADNNTLRQENERIHCENLAIGETMKNVICPTCGDPPFGEEDRQRNIQQLKIENALLKQEHERMSLILENISGNPASSTFSPTFTDSTLDIPPGLHGQLGQRTKNYNFDPRSGLQFKCKQEMEKAMIVEEAASAMTELIELLRVDEPLWVRSQNHEGAFVLHRENYEKIFPKVNHFTSSSVESSKDSCVVAMPPQQLLDMFLDSSKWADLFPTIVSKSTTLAVLDSGNLTGSLILMNVQMHVFSPLVLPREFFLIRYCQPLDNASAWVVVDVTYDYTKEIQNTSLIRCRKLPSGCLIQGLPDGKTQITWVEHVEVEDKSRTHRLYHDLIKCGHAYRAKRWTTTLQRMCDRLMYTMRSKPSPMSELDGVINNFPEGRRSILKLSQKMVKDFCTMLSASDKPDLQSLSDSNSNKVRVFVRKSEDINQPHASIVSAATSVWLPVSHDSLFHFFKDENMRTRWDVVSSGYPVKEIANISWGTHPENYVSIIQPNMRQEKNMVMLQENYIDNLCSLIAYAPIGLQVIMAAVNDDTATGTTVLPSGFVIFRSPVNFGRITGTSTSTGGKIRQDGSLLTIAFQILVSTQTKQTNIDAIATLNSLISSTVNKIKVAFNCSDDSEL